jgi:predicted amidohydrolase
MTDRSWLPAHPRRIRVAAVQTPAAPNVAAGLERATPLVARAAADGAQLVLLPELMATHYVFTADMWDSAEPDQGPTVRWLRDTAQRLGIWLGTSYLQASGDDFFNTFVLAGPSGEEAGRVRKQTPAMCMSPASSEANRDHTSSTPSSGESESGSATTTTVRICLHCFNKVERTCC